VEDCPWFTASHPESVGINYYPDGERTAGKALAVRAVTRVNQVRRLRDLVAEPAALAAAGLWKSHRRLPVGGFSLVLEAHKSGTRQEIQ
jgi:hypothetical protein